jgi:putative ABC transport system substrate-binding protein
VKRREFITLLGGAAAWPLAGRAQQAAMPVIGFLDSRVPDAVTDRLRNFRQGLKDTGYVEGENVAIVYRFAENQDDRLPALAAELVSRRVAVIAAAGAPPTFAAKAATTTIPIVFLVGDDPARLGLVTTLSGLQIQIHNGNTSAEIDTVFETMSRERPDAVFVATSAFLNGRRVQLAQLATFHRLPAIYGLREYVEVGGLMSYGPNIVDAFRQMGVYAGRILKGAKPADLPVVQSSKFELIINAATARMLGLTVPDKLLAAAAEVIE